MQWPDVYLSVGVRDAEGVAVRVGEFDRWVLNFFDNGRHAWCEAWDDSVGECHALPHCASAHERPA